MIKLLLEPTQELWRRLTGRGGGDCVLPVSIISPLTWTLWYGAAEGMSGSPRSIFSEAVGLT